MKTLEERIEAAIKTVLNSGIGTIYDVVKPVDIAAMLRNAFPELFDGSHVLLPREPTEEMLRGGAGAIMVQEGSSLVEMVGTDEAECIYRGIISAYESNQGS